MMQDRKTELEEFKRLPLSIVAADFGWEVDRKKSTRHSVLMRKDAQKIIISKRGGHYVWCSVSDNASGTVIDFIQQLEKPGCSLGGVRQILRRYTGDYLTQVQSKHKGRYAEGIKENTLDLASVASRLEKMSLVTGHNRYLCDERGVAAELLASDRFRGLIRHDARYNSVAFPHHGSPEEGSDERVLVGYEIKGSISMYSKGGTKGLFASRGGKNDRTLAITESGVEALSFVAAHDSAADTRAVSIGGRMSPQQPKLLLAAMERMEQGSTIVAAMNNDSAGDDLVKQAESLFRELKRGDLNFADLRAPLRGQDWNDVVKQQALEAGRLKMPGMSLGR